MAAEIKTPITMLVDKDGTLYLPNGDILLYRYPRTEECEGGDVDTIAWPLVSKEWRIKLASCLYDEWMCGSLGKDCNGSVKLPDGTEFRIELELG